MSSAADDDNQMIASSMRIPNRLRDDLTRLAKAHKRSFNKELLWALERYIEHEERGQSDRSSREKRRYRAPGHPGSIAVR
jgi:hypothetical protein